MLIRYLLTSVAPIIERAHFSARKRFLGPTDEDFWSNFNSVAPKGTPHSPSTNFLHVLTFTLLCDRIKVKSEVSTRFTK